MSEQQKQLAGGHLTFAPSPVPLDEWKILFLYGDLIEESFLAYQTDPCYLIDMMQDAARLEPLRNRIYTDD